MPAIDDVRRSGIDEEKQLVEVLLHKDDEEGIEEEEEEADNDDDDDNEFQVLLPFVDSVILPSANETFLKGATAAEDVETSFSFILCSDGAFSPIRIEEGSGGCSIPEGSCVCGNDEEDNKEEVKEDPNNPFTAVDNDTEGGRRPAGPPEEVKDEADDEDRLSLFTPPHAPLDGGFKHPTPIGG